MIRFESVTVTYRDAERPAIRDVELAIPEGELALVIGRTGAGKSTLLKAINGLVPHFTGGTLAGRVLVDGRDTRTTRHANSPMSSDTSVRIRSPASSPTVSKKTPSWSFC